MMITEEMISNLGLWCLNYDKDFSHLRTQGWISFTPSGLNYFLLNWQSISDSNYIFGIESVRAILKELLKNHALEFLIEISEPIELLSFSNMLYQSVVSTFNTYQNENEFYEHVKLTTADFESIVNQQLGQVSQDELFQTFILDFDAIQNELDRLIAHKGYIFDDALTQWVASA